MGIRSICIATALVATSACGKKSEKQEPPPATTEPAPPEVAAPTESCPTRIDAISARLAPYVDKVRVLTAERKDVKLAASKAARPIDQGGLVVTVGKNLLEIAGQRVGSLTALGTSLEARRQAGNLGEDGSTASPAPLYYQVDAALPVSALAAVVSATPKGFQARLLVGRPTAHESRAVPEGASPEVRALLDGLGENSDPAARASLLAKSLQAAIGLCAPLVELFGSLASLPPDEKQRALVSGFGRALRSCNCQGVDLDVLEVFLLEVSGAYRDAQGWLPLERDSRGRLAPVPGLADSATVSDLVEALAKTK